MSKHARRGFLALPKRVSTALITTITAVALSVAGFGPSLAFATDPVPAVDPNAPITTVATDKADGDHTVAADGTIVDVVNYKGLVPGVTYVLHTQLFDKTNNVLTSFQLATFFTPTTPDGSITVEIPVPPGSAGKTLVVYETIWRSSDVLVSKNRDNVTPIPGRTPVLVETDPNNEDQTVVVPPPPSTTCTVAGVAWKDADGNQLIGSTEEKVAGLTVNLYKAPVGSTTTPVATTTTDANGAYKFNLSGTQCADSYVKFAGTPTTLSGWEPFGGGDSNLDPTKLADRTTTVFGLTTGQDVTAIDAGFKKTVVAPTSCTVNGVVWKDANNNQLRDAGETLVPNVRVDLRKAGADGSFPGTWVASTTTDANGRYEFVITDASVCSKFFVDFDERTIPGGWTQFSGGDSDLLPSNTVDGWTPMQSLPLGGKVDNIDMGLKQVLTGCVVSGHVWKDTNNNKLRDAGEPLVSGITVDLRLPGSGGSMPGTLHSSTKTDANGYYEFQLGYNTKCSSFFIDFNEQQIPSGWTQFAGGDSDLLPSNVVDGWTGLQTVAPGGRLDNIDMGLKQVLTGCVVSGHVWKDTNNNKLRDAGEPLVSGITVDLRLPGSGGSMPGTLHSSTKTDANGYYEFQLGYNTKCSSFFIDFNERDIPSGWTQFAGGDSDLLPSNVVDGWTGLQTVAPGGRLDNLDMGLRQLQSCTISGVIWLDSNKDGLISTGETRVSGAKVLAFLAPYFTLSYEIASGTTDANGAYKITIPEKYCASQVFVQPLATSATSGWSAFAGGDSKANPSYLGWPFTNPAQMTSGADSPNNNVGYRQSGEIQGNFCYGACGINGGVVKLINTATGAVVQTQIVQNNSFSFKDVPSGRYWVSYTQNYGRYQDYYLYGLVAGGSWAWSNLMFYSPNTVLEAGTFEFNYTAGTVLKLSGCSGRMVSPIMLDTNHNGKIDTSNVASQSAGAKFDLLSTGSPVQSGWSAGGDGFLVQPNADGSVTSGKNLFGGGLGEGYAKLAKLDANHDGVLTGSELSTLKVWIDANNDHTAAASEIHDLGDYGIVSISVKYDVTPRSDNGNVVIEHSHATLRNGSTMVMADAYFGLGHLNAANKAASDAMAERSKATARKWDQERMRAFVQGGGR